MVGQDFVLEITPQQTRTQAGELRNEAQAYRACTAELYASSEHLLTMWEGPSQVEFRQQLEIDRPEFDRLYQELNAFCDAVEESVAKYEQTQENIAAGMQRR